MFGFMLGFRFLGWFGQVRFRFRFLRFRVVRVGQVYVFRVQVVGSTRRLHRGDKHDGQFRLGQVSGQVLGFQGLGWLGQVRLGFGLGFQGLGRLGQVILSNFFFSFFFLFACCDLYSQDECRYHFRSYIIRLRYMYPQTHN